MTRLDDAVTTPATARIDAGRLRHLDGYFERLLVDGRIPGWSAQVGLGHELVHESSGGYADIEAKLPFGPDVLIPAMSLSKPLTSVLALALYERGYFGLHDPIAQYLPEFAAPQVYRRGGAVWPETRPAAEPIRIHHLFTHTSGLAYGFHQAHPVDEIYLKNGFGWGSPPGISLAQAVEIWAGIPLLYEPGTSWNYSVATDVLGRILELVTGEELPDLLRTYITEPLGLRDTGFIVPESRQSRLGAIYSPDPAGGRVIRSEPLSAIGRAAPSWWSAGSGIITTVADYGIFLRALAAGGVAADGTRILGAHTLRFATRNQLPQGVSLGDSGRDVVPALDTLDGLGFGLGFATVENPADARVPSSPGEYFWLSANSFHAFVDPGTGLWALAAPQLFPSKTLPLLSRFRQVTYQALTR
ncbi:serine hydrolase [Nocardia sp. SYP-A9097]|uniref:serine hydrolase domain-containing protein n=1 Tax=Nocardia sp. SYP-A9097 TaxID=2663237 RepID=UPI00129A8AA3|nr:serine hydrolase domain-containing protein [Nocardia sp. SYP-A9097]MRH89628.1 serine hydrolase [Nocardia sp. SYP-A9097]